MGLPMLLVMVGVVDKVLVRMGLVEKELEMALVKHTVRVAWQKHQLRVLVVLATLMLAAVVLAVAVETMEMEAVTAKELDKLAAMTLLEEVPLDREAATVAATLTVSLKVQASELGLVLAPELDRLVALALMVQAMPPDSVAAPVAAQVVATMAGQPVVEAPDLESVAVDTLKFPISGKLEWEPNTHF